MGTKKMICFDMDGTIADLYGVENWLEMLRNEDATPYYEAKPMWDMEQLRRILLDLGSQGWDIRVITWLSKDSSEDYKTEVRNAKRWWLEVHRFPFEVAHMVAYGTTKADCVRKMETAEVILIDDNAKVRDGWTLGRTIDPTACDLLKVLGDLREV